LARKLLAAKGLSTANFLQYNLLLVTSIQEIKKTRPMTLAVEWDVKPYQSNPTICQWLKRIAPTFPARGGHTEHRAAEDYYLRNCVG